MPLNIGAENTDKELWRDEAGNRVFITKDGIAVGLCAGGRCVVKTLKEWVQLGWAQPVDRIERLEDAVHELNPGWFPSR